MISLHYTSHTKAYNTIYTACNIVEAIYSFTTHLASSCPARLGCHTSRCLRLGKLQAAWRYATVTDYAIMKMMIIFRWWWWWW